MKIVIAAWHLKNFNVGIGRYTRNLIEGIRRVDQENHYEILVPNRESSIAEGPNMHCRYSRLLNFKRPYWEQFAPLCLGKYDVLHFPYDSCIAFKRGKFVATIHDVIPLLFPKNKRNWPWKGLIKRMMIPRPFDQIDHVVTVSQCSKRDIMKTLGVPDERISVVYQGVESDRFVPLPASAFDEYKRNSYVLCVSGNGYTKNAKTLIHAFSRMSKGLRSKYPLVLAGSIQKESDLPSLIAKLGLKNQISFTGIVSDERLVSLYQNASAFVFPTLYEGFGLPVLESMACGCPVITANASSLPEVVGEAGLLVDPLDPSAMSGALERVLTDRDLARRLREAGLQRAREFSWNRTARETVEVYRKVVGTGPSQ